MSKWHQRQHHHRQSRGSPPQTATLREQMRLRRTSAPGRLSAIQEARLARPGTARHETAGAGTGGSQAHAAQLEHANKLLSEPERPDKFPQWRRSERACCPAVAEFARNGPRHPASQCGLGSWASRRHPLRGLLGNRFERKACSPLKPSFTIERPARATATCRRRAYKPSRLRDLAGHQWRRSAVVSQDHAALL